MQFFYSSNFVNNRRSLRSNISVTMEWGDKPGCDTSLYAIYFQKTYNIN